MAEQQNTTMLGNLEMWINIKHWSHCWGGHTTQKPIRCQKADIRQLLQEQSWLSTFLNQTNLDNIRLGQIIGTEDGFRKELAGQEYNLRVRYTPKSPQQNLVITTCANGKTVESSGYEDLRVGNGTFQGYRLKPEKERYTLTLLYHRDEQGLFNHAEFAATPKKTIIASHLFSLDSSVTLNAETDFSRIAPALTSIIVYDPLSPGNLKIRK